MVTKMKKAGIVTKVSPWLHEQQADSRYVGLRIAAWDDIIGPQNILAKFVSENKQSQVHIFLANKTPFLFLTKKNLAAGDKWELILGSLKQRLNREKHEYQAGKPQIDSLYTKIIKSK